MRLLLFILVLIPFVAPRSADAGTAIPSVGDLIASLGSPASEEAVSKALATARYRDKEYGVALARALGRTGGPSAMEGLVDLMRSRYAEVHVAVFEAVETLDLRHAGLVEHAALAAQRGTPAVREAAFGALSRTGDATHLSIMLRCLEDADPGVRHTALRALRGVTGASRPPSRASWSKWWTRYGARGRKDLHAALDALADETTPIDLRTISDVIERYGWIDLPAVRLEVRALLHRSETTLQVEGCRLAQALRLADLGADVSSLYRYASEKRVIEAAQACARAFNIPLHRDRLER
ncbi:MAG: hypothetical protein QNJ90_00700 [Planctomycetota bacterium]|nr:hypothetical protein [Planctomycetota bacterium]